MRPSHLFLILMFNPAIWDEDSTGTEETRKPQKDRIAVSSSEQQPVQHLLSIYVNPVFSESAALVNFCLRINHRSVYRLKGARSCYERSKTLRSTTLDHEKGRTLSRTLFGQNASRIQYYWSTRYGQPNLQKCRISRLFTSLPATLYNWPQAAYLR